MREENIFLWSSKNCWHWLEFLLQIYWPMVVNCVSVFEDIFHTIISQRLLFHWVSEATVKPKRWQRPEKNEQRKSGQATQKLLSLLPSFTLKIFRHLMKRYLTIEKCLNRELRIPFGVWFTIVIFMQRERNKIAPRSCVRDLWAGCLARMGA